MKKPEIKPEINESIDGNAFAILGTVSKALKKAGADTEYIKKYQEEATKGDYDHLLRTSMEYVNFNFE